MECSEVVNSDAVHRFAPVETERSHSALVHRAKHVSLILTEHEKVLLEVIFITIRFGADVLRVGWHRLLPMLLWLVNESLSLARMPLSVLRD